jgi:hypothetical protein
MDQLELLRRGATPRRVTASAARRRLKPSSLADPVRDGMSTLRPPRRDIRIRLLMPLQDAEELAERLSATENRTEVQRLLDQLWLRSVLIEQWRRTRLAERGEFERRADRILGGLDP